MQSSVISYRISSLHFPAGHSPLMCASYSSLKYFRVERMGLGAVPHSAHRLPFLVHLARLSRFSRSCSVPFPEVIFTRISSMRLVPMRPKLHFPHASFWVNVRK